LQLEIDGPRVRWVACHSAIDKQRSDASILSRLLRPGGSITVLEGDHGSTHFHPDRAAAHAAIQCLITLQREAGGDALIGPRLYPLMVAAGFDAVRVFPRMVYVDSSRPDLIDGFTRKTFAAMIEGIRGAAIAARLTSRRASTRRPRSSPNDRGGRCVLLYILQGCGRQKARRLSQAPDHALRWQQHVLSEGEAGSGSPKALVYFVCLGVFATE
jgi:hypothetical protein